MNDYVYFMTLEKSSESVCLQYKQENVFFTFRVIKYREDKNKFKIVLTQEKLNYDELVNMVKFNGQIYRDKGYVQNS